MRKTLTRPLSLFAKNEKTLHDQLTVVENVRSYLNGKYPECLNTLRADVACWLIESGFKDANEIRAEYSDLLNAGVIMSLPKNRRIKIFISFSLESLSSITFIIIFLS